MTPLVFVAVVAAGGVGAALRFVLDSQIRRRTGERFPWGILAVNISGAFVLGILSRLPADEAWRWIIGAGLLGGYTTFSAVAVTTVLLAEDARSATAINYAALSFAGSFFAAAVGLALGALF